MRSVIHAHGAGSFLPASDEALAGGTPAEGSKGNIESGRSDCDHAGAGSQDAAAKNIATLQAQAALIGVRVDRITADDGGHVVFRVSRWHLTRDCKSLAELEVLLDRMGVLRS